ncbi:MAG: HNH endonuclease [Candidatus Ranarchaeia archaeon]
MIKKRPQCYYCGSTRHIEEEHVRPESRGGVSTVQACQKCNRSKGDKTPAEWLDWLTKNDRPHWRRIAAYQKGKRSPFAQMVRKRR